MAKRTLDERFWSKVTKTDGCWLWTGARDSQGYGNTWVDGGYRKAHWVAWFLTYGSWPEAVLDHVQARGCLNKNCVNPAHLEDVTQRENVHRSLGPAAVNAAKTHCGQGHPLSGDNLRVTAGAYGPKRRCRACDHNQRLVRQANGSRW